MVGFRRLVEKKERGCWLGSKLPHRPFDVKGGDPTSHGCARLLNRHFPDAAG